jgi:transcriptional regulator with XRE-family HTH domain
LLIISRVEELIADKGWKAPYFCKQFGRSRTWIADWKRGSLPGEEMLEPIAALLDTTVGYITGKTDEKKKPETDESFRLTNDEIELIKSYRSLNPEIQAAIDRLTGIR